MQMRDQPHNRHKQLIHNLWQMQQFGQRNHTRSSTVKHELIKLLLTGSYYLLFNW
jgi:hypothetical protein